MYEKKPWVKFYEGVPESLDYPDMSLYERLMETVKKYPNATAYDFVNTSASYQEMANEIDRLASALWVMGVRPGDTMTISMPTTPQGVMCVYALNKIGAIASMIHPLSPPPQIEMYLNLSKSKWAMTVDMFYDSFKPILDKTSVQKLLLTKIPDKLGGILKVLFWLKKGRTIKVPADPKVVWWKDLMFRTDLPKVETAKMNTNDLAIILYSGGTTGVPKGIMLSNRNIIAEGWQVAYWAGMDPKDSILAILPIFHGFGLGVCVNAAFMGGGKSILVPTFTPETVADLVMKKRPTFLIGVPTLFQALANNPKFQAADLSCLKATFSGADTLPAPVKAKFEETVRKANGNVVLREGYGLTEAVTACMALPLKEYRQGSIGIPFPDMLAKIVKSGSTDEAPVGEEGEICVSGPDVMLGYLDNPKATAEVLKKHPDGRIWLHTGDLGKMDADGFFYFTMRLKRMIKSSGVNVYPTHVESIMQKHDLIKDVCVIGVPDEQQVSRVKAFIVLKDKSQATAQTKNEIYKYCTDNLLKWECPRDMEFRDDLPKTLVGKIAYKDLEEEEIKKLKAAGKFSG